MNTPDIEKVTNRLGREFTGAMAGDPDAFLPGNNMEFLFPRPQERQDIISYLRQTSGK